jgi:hypothetical protein
MRSFLAVILLAALAARRQNATTPDSDAQTNWQAIDQLCGQLELSTPKQKHTGSGKGYNLSMPYQHAVSTTRECWTYVLISSAYGFAFGLLDGIPAGSVRHWSRYGFEFSRSILGGRAFSPKPEPRRLPLLPKAILIALCSTAVIVLLLQNDCPDFFDRHWLFSITWLICGSSVTVWLTKSSVFQRKASEDRDARVEKFLSSPAPTITARAEKLPIVLALWNLCNVTFFAILMLIVAVSMRGGK